MAIYRPGPGFRAQGLGGPGLKGPYADRPGPGAPRRRSAIHKLLLALVWITVASGAIVFTEPAPVDLLTMILIVLLPAAGLAAITTSLLSFLSLWLVIAAAAIGAAMMSMDPSISVVHSTVSLYLYLAAFIFAAFIARNPLTHTRLVMNAYLFGTLLAALAGLVGYFDLLPGAHDLLTKFGRASGTFKDPNVYGPFLIPGLIYAIHLVVSRPLLRAILPLASAAIIAAAIMLSFSRGAWMALAIALVVWGYMSFITAPTHRQRLKLIALAMAGLFVATLMLTAALQFDSVSELFSQRASLDHSYDFGPDGRFGGQEKARDLILDNPLGLGAMNFNKYFHPEDVHNVYLSMFLNAGWLGGFLYVFLIGLTAIFGLRHGLRRQSTQPLFLLIYAAFIGNMLEGLIVDTDHWRHFYLLLGILWGLMAAGKERPLPQHIPQRQATLIGPAKRRRRPTLRRRARVLRPAHRRLPRYLPRRRRTGRQIRPMYRS